MPDPATWELTAAAVRQYLRIIGADDEAWTLAEQELRAHAQRAHYVRDTDSGAQTWATGRVPCGGRKTRLEMTVIDDQLVRVRDKDGGRKRPQGRGVRDRAARNREEAVENSAGKKLRVALEYTSDEIARLIALGGGERPSPGRVSAWLSGPSNRHYQRMPRAALLALLDGIIAVERDGVEL